MAAKSNKHMHVFHWINDIIESIDNITQEQTVLKLIERFKVLYNHEPDCDELVDELTQYLNQKIYKTI